MKKLLFLLLLPTLLFAQRTNVKDINGTRYAEAFDWTASPAGSLTGGSAATVTLPSGINGVDTSNTATTPYYVYVAGTGTPEAVIVTGGTYTTSAGGTILFTPVNSHSAGFTVQSASRGIQEALNDASSNANINLQPAGAQGSNIQNVYTIYGRVTPRVNNVSIWGGGATLKCMTSDSCFTASASFGPVHLHDLRMGSGVTNNGALITNTSCAANTATITTTLNPGAGSFVDVQSTFNNHYWGIHQVLSSSGSSWTYTDTACGGSGTLAADNSAGKNAQETAGIEFANQWDSAENILFGNPGGITGKFNNGIVIYNDQAAVIRGVSSSGMNCSSTYCGSGVYAPGPFVNAAVIYLSNANLSMNCQGNGVTAWSGNTLDVSNSVIQGYNQWGIYTGTPRGGFGPTTASDVYMEVGNCTNPDYSPPIQAQAGVMVVGNRISWRGGEGPQGGLQTFGSGGSTAYYYYIVPIDSVLGKGQPLYAGSCTSTTTCVVQWPRIRGTNTVTYDGLRTTTTNVAPYFGGCAGGSTAACGSVFTAQAQCSGLVCSFTDTVTNPTTSYVVPNLFNNDRYIPGLSFWPGTFVLGENLGDILGFNNIGVSLHMDVSPGGGIISPAGAIVPKAVANDCSGGNGQALLWIECTNTGGATVNATGALMIPNGIPFGGTTANIKGRFNFVNQITSINSFDLMTLVDSNPYKTYGTSGNRPLADAADTAIGLDSGSTQLNLAGLALRAPISISQYINSLGDGTSWKERLTANLKDFKVQVVTEQNLQINGGASLGTNSNLNYSNNSDTHTLTNNSGTGTVCNELVKLDGSGKAIVTAGGETANDVLGVATGGCSNTGSVTFADHGEEQIIFDAPPTLNHFVGISASSGLVTDAGVAPTSGQPIGRVIVNPDGSSPTNCTIAPGCYVMLQMATKIPYETKGDALVTDPAADQVAQATTDTPSLTVRQVSGGTQPVFRVLKSDATNFFNISNIGSGIFGTGAGGDVNTGRFFSTLYIDLLDQVSDPAGTPAASHIFLYNKNKVPCAKDQTGTITCGLGGGGGGGNMSTSPAGNQNVSQPNATNLNVNRFEHQKFADQFAGTGTTGGIQEAINDCSGSCIVWLPSGTTTACGVTVPANVSVFGYGLSTTIVQCATAGTAVFTVTGSGAELRYFTAKHITNTPTAGGNGITVNGGAARVKIEDVKTNFNWDGLSLGWTSYGEVNWIVSEFNQNNGVTFVPDATNKVNQWEVRGGLVEQNLGDGFNLVLPGGFTNWQGTCPHFSAWAQTFGNEGKGWNLSASAATTSGIADCWFDGTFSSQNNSDGYFLDPGTSGGRNWKITNAYSEQAGTYTGTAGFAQGAQTATNVGYGFNLTAACDSTPAPQLADLMAWNNSYSGVYVGCAGTSLTNISTFKNGNAATGSAFQQAGITVRANNVSIVGGYHRDSGGKETAGIEVSNSADTPSIVSPICDSSISTCVVVTTQPASGFITQINGRRFIYKSAAASGSCSNGDHWYRTDSGNFTTEWACVNAAWSAMVTAATQNSTQLIAFCTGVVSSGSGATNVLFPGNPSSITCGQTSATEMPMAYACTAQNMFAKALTAGAVAGSGALTLYKNGSATTVTCTLGTGTTCNDTSHTASFAAGDTWSVRTVSGQANDTTNSIHVAFQCQ